MLRFVERHTRSYTEALNVLHCLENAFVIRRYRELYLAYEGFPNFCPQTPNGACPLTPLGTSAPMPILLPNPDHSTAGSHASAYLLHSHSKFPHYVWNSNWAMRKPSI